MHPIAWAVTGWLLSLTLIFLMMGWLSSRPEARRTYRRCAAAALMTLTILIPVFVLEGFLPWPF
ncbi:hypothetical protein [Bifidobacterium felsineum]|uniref:hypothetical protein n=1 Tax=Bifidobacterium felsineum TaxID=2045440 RepID=UPI001BDCA112|nr:hypothetical protein [Bifidobacterium felsineum]MBT1164595.1 hypothetical protein [Bifidobacterium felsineum]